eukprot:3589991-Prymnesium_polylepis.1
MILTTRVVAFMARAQSARRPARSYSSSRLRRAVLEVLPASVSILSEDGIMKRGSRMISCGSASRAR